MEEVEDDDDISILHIFEKYLNDYEPTVGCIESDVVDEFPGVNQFAFAEELISDTTSETNQTVYKTASHNTYDTKQTVDSTASFSRVSDIDCCPVNTSDNSNNNRVTVSEQTTSYHTKTGSFKRVATSQDHTIEVNDRNNDKKKALTSSTISNERLTQLMTFPTLFQDCINSADLHRLRLLMVEYCIENLSFQPPGLPTPLIGHENIIAYYRLLLFDYMTDLVVLSKPCKRYKRIISCEASLIGSFQPSNGYTPSYPDHINSFKSSDLDPIITQANMLKYQQLEAQNKPIVIKLKYYKHIILNKELTAIEKIITFPRGLEVEEYIPKNQA